MTTPGRCSWRRPLRAVLLAGLSVTMTLIAAMPASAGPPDDPSGMPVPELAQLLREQAAREDVDRASRHLLRHRADRLEEELARAGESESPLLEPLRAEAVFWLDNLRRSDEERARPFPPARSAGWWARLLSWLSLPSSPPAPEPPAPPTVPASRREPSPDAITEPELKLGLKILGIAPGLVGDAMRARLAGLAGNYRMELLPGDDPGEHPMVSSLRDLVDEVLTQMLWRVIAPSRIDPVIRRPDHWLDDWVTVGWLDGWRDDVATVQRASTALDPRFSPQSSKILGTAAAQNGRFFEIADPLIRRAGRGAGPGPDGHPADAAASPSGSREELGRQAASERWQAVLGLGLEEGRSLEQMRAVRDAPAVRATLSRLASFLRDQLPELTGNGGPPPPAEPVPAAGPEPTGPGGTPHPGEAGSQPESPSPSSAATGSAALPAPAGPAAPPGEAAHGPEATEEAPLSDPPTARAGSQPERRVAVSIEAAVSPQGLAALVSSPSAGAVPVPIGTPSRQVPAAGTQVAAPAPADAAGRAEGDPADADPVLATLAAGQLGPMTPPARVTPGDGAGDGTTGDLAAGEGTMLLTSGVSGQVTASAGPAPPSWPVGGSLLLPAPLGGSTTGAAGPGPDWRAWP